MPDVVLVHVLSYLSDVDRCNASLACTTWRRAFRHPSLWRRRYFVFRAFDAFEKLDSYLKFLSQLGWHMQSMDVELCRPNINTASIIARTFEQFVIAVNKTWGIRLLTFRIVNADFHSCWHFFSHNRSKVIRSLSSLLKKQSYLRTVDLSYCLMDRDEGTRLLEALSYGTRLHSKAYLSDINLRQFFSPRTRAASFVRYGKVMGQFQALAAIRMDFRALNEVILDRLSRASSETLSRMELDFYSDEFMGSQAISPERWRSVSRRLPGLRVKVRVHGLCGFQKYASVLVRELPLSELRVTYLGVENLADHGLLLGVHTLLVYLADTFHRTLTKLHLHLRPDLDVSADAAVVGLVRRCLHLRELNVNVALQASTVVLILDTIHRQRSQPSPVPPLPAKKTRFHLNVRGMTPELDRSIRLMTSAGYSDVTTRTLSAPSSASPPAAVNGGGAVFDGGEQ
ncbi:F-box only protein 39-like [Babylonia areolata]|uniref:F-box only protein 39-like n=1 Tax=Babylonia areolata TaxID=304850 RepID=UPI003FD5C53D